ncbi:hemicentin-1-like isoform X10 [Branchiostoma lanceolatum]|uniref:hemicentin-1-like isoform X10 n=1 Tax=Branchiostoma lanceolatum TaxID=7740 RepID=UPI0034566E71
MLINGDLASPKEPEEIPVKPKFMDKFKGTLVVEEGGTLTLTFKVVGVPTPKITWMQGDKVLKPSSRIKMTTSDGDVTIVVKAVTMEEAGIYTCVAENSEGEAFCSATIKVKAKPKAECPKIILKKTRVTAGEGDNVRLEAIVKGEEVKVQWTQDGTLLRDSQETRYERKGETFALVIPLVEKEDSGKYTVEASNEGGKDEATVLLVVKDMSMPARILKKPESTSVLEGEAAAFTCEVEGSPPPTVSWAKDGRLLHDDGRVSLRTEGKTHTLEITKTLISHSADYVCMASNKHGEDNCDFSLTVEELPVPPVFKKTPKDETVEEGKWVKFVCEVDGAPAPEAQWFRGDHLITTTGLCRVRTSSFTPLLEIYSVRVEDAGNYRCIVKNDGGEISCHFKLGVTAKPTSPRITRKPASETVKEDQKVTFTSKVTGYPRPEVTWSKDGRTIQEDERHIIAVDGQTYTLEILSAVFSDEGNWACVARNKRGQDKCIFTLTVQEKPFPPEFVIKPKSTTVEEGSEAVFDVQVDGEPQPKVTWVKDDEEIVHTRKRQIIDDGDRHSLVIPSAAVSDAGNYICKVTNSEGEVSCDFNFNVNRKPCPPEFLTKPRSGIIDEGTNHSFECELGGEPLPVVTWHKEGKQLSQDDRIRIRTEENKAFLSLLPTEMADSGKWSIIAKNVRGQKKYEFTLSIREVPVPPEFVKSPESITIDEGEAAEFACEITGKPAPMVNWYKDSTQVKQDARHTVSADGTVYSLDIKPALITDKGNYKVVARGANEQQTSEFKLTVREKFSPPTFPSAPKDITADVGKPIKVTVEIKGEPKPSVKWTKKDKKTKVLEGGDGYSITSSGNKYTLEILCADFKDSAEYTIEASNIRGSVSKSFKINVVEVKVPPEFLSKPEDQTVMEGESVEFSCEVEGDPEPQVIWSKDSHPLHEGGQFSITTVDFSSTLEIDNVTLDNKGTYTCTIRNKHGEKKCTVTLNVDERPFPPEFLEPPASQTVEEGKSAKFTCEVDGEPAPKVSWEKDGQTLKKGKRYKISGDEFSSTLEIPTVLSTDGGSYACVLENAEGTITEEFNLMVQEGEQHKEITQDQLQSLLSSIDSGSTEDTDMFYSIDEASPPEFKSELNNIVCKEDEEVVFSCTVHGAPDPEITWYKDGKSIKPSKYFQMSYDGETAELTLDGAFPEDSGVYTCTARNPAGDVSKSAKLTVEELESPLKRSMSEEEDVTAGPSPPKFSQALQDEVCERNSIAQLTCKVSGNPKPRVTWMKGDTVLTEGDRYEIFEEKGSFNMEIYDTLPSDSGTYTCVASNAHGTVKCSAELLIADGDELEAAEENREGMFARKPLPHEDEEEEEEISSEGTVNTVTESHAFSEDQELDDEVARAMREEAKPAEVNVAVGQRVELKADIPGNPRIRWLHNGMEVSDTKFSKYLTTGDLHVLALSKVGPEHAGVFTCEATTPDGIVTCDIIIKVEEPKEPPETPKTQVKEGHRVELKAEIPDSRRIEWLLDGKLIRETEDRRYTSFGNMHSLTIISVKPEDAGTYTCVAMTPRGEVTCNIKLEVEKSSNQEVIKMVEMDQSLQAQELKLPEEPCTQPTTLDVLEGQEVTLRAEVPVSPSHHPTVLPIDDADVTWLFNDKEISNTESIAVSATNHTSTLTIRKVQREFEGTYTCIATTPHGTGRCQIILHIIPSSPPNVTSSMRKQTVRTQELTFRVPMLLMERSTAPGTIDIQEGQELNIRAEIPGKPDITWLFNGKELKASDEVQFGVDKDVYMLTVTKVTRHWSGTFTCIAKTPSGKTVCDIVVNVKEATDQHLEMEKTLETEGAEVQMQQWRLRSPVQTTQATPAVAQFEVKEGQEVTLRAEIPDPWSPHGGQADIMWMFEGKELSESDNISFSSDGDVHILKINNVTSDFSGKFTCVAKTDHGAATCDILLTVGPPTLTQKTTELLQIQRPAAQTPPQFFEVKEGQEVNLRAEVPGSKSVKWSFNGKELSKSDQLTFFSEYDIHTLRITKVTKEWAGTFTCSAATETGETTCDIVLSIKDSDLALRGDRTESRIAKEMQVTSQVVRKDTGASTEVTVKEGQEVTLQAGIPGNYIIKWLHGGKLLPDSAAFKQMTKGDLHILTIPKIKREHAGTYTCQATSGTTTVKCDIIVHVTEQERLVPPDFKIKPRSQRVEKGGTVSLISEVSGEPKPSVSWLKDGKEVLETSRITTRHVGKNYILEISDAGEEDSGSYTCVGTNAAGQYSCTATLHVYDELIGGYHIAGNGSALATTNVGTVTSTHVEVPEGQQVSLQATLPEPIPGDDVKWMYNGEELNPSTLYKQSTRGTTHTLTINRVSKQQEGTYTCEATGPTGVSKCDLVITVLPKKKEMVPPDFVSQPKPATVDDGESVEFCCQITGDPQPEVHWLKNGQELCGWTASRTFVTSSSTAGGSTSRPSVRGTPSAWTVSRLATQESSSAWQPTPEGSAPAQFRFT